MGGPFDPDKLLAEFRLYDRTVDVVSAYHWFFTETRDMPATVEHFERYPCIAHTDGRPATPDFSVLYTDGSGLVAEIANIARHDNSIEKLCSQLLRYDKLTQLPGRAGPVNASPIDVLYLAPMDDAESAANRIFRDRLLNQDHPFSPSRPPVMVQFGLMSDKYVFQKWPDKSINGSLTVSSRGPDYAKFDESLKIHPRFFDQNKVRYAFANDPIQSLYLATRLWVSVFPSTFATEEFSATTSEIIQALHSQYGRGRSKEVKAAMNVLVAARLVVDEKDKWRVKRNRNLRGQGDQVAEAIAELVGKDLKVGTAPRRRSREVEAQYGETLLDLL